MKHVFLIALSLTAHHIIAMDKPAKTVATQTNNNAALDEIVANIDKSINEKYLRSSLLEQFSVFGKKEENYHNILSTPKAIYPNIIFTENLLDKLYAKNSIFAQAIDYLVNYDLTSFENVTPANLNTVNDFNAPQSIPLFNGFDQSIRKYILQRATNKIEHECTMKIVTGATVIDFDICPKTDTVAISTGDRQTRSRLCLWDLKRVAPLHTFEEENPVHFVCFNTLGNQLATVVVLAGKSKIKIWNPQSKQLLHTIEPDYECLTCTLAYNDHPTNHLLHAIYYNYTHKSGGEHKMETWLTSAEHCLPCGLSTQLETVYARDKTTVKKEPYRALNPKCDDVKNMLDYIGLKPLTLDITKTNCSDLYLCEQAIKKAQNKQSLNLITESNPFKTATVYEQALIRELLGKKRNQLIS